MILAVGALWQLLRTGVCRLPSWEYRLELISLPREFDRDDLQRRVLELQQRLNEIGAEGWELVSEAQVPMVGKLTLKVKERAHLLIFRRTRQP